MVSVDRYGRGAHLSWVPRGVANQSNAVESR